MMMFDMHRLDLLQNNYEINDYADFGIPFVEVYGDTFAYLDLYELVGKQQFMTTFNFKENSEAYSVYGDSVIGTIYYNRKINKKLQDSCEFGDESDFSKIHIVVPPSEKLSIEKIESLKYEYGGFLISDIESISFFPYQREVERHTTGEKKVPNIINIEVDCSDIDPDILCRAYLFKKNDDGVDLIFFEKEQFIGITLALNEKRIDSRILEHFGFTLDDVSKNMNVWYYFYQTKERRNTLLESDKQKYIEIQEILNTEKFNKVMKELLKSGVKAEALKNTGKILPEIMNSCLSFKPSILLHGKKQIYWNLDSFVHILMRHVKNYQLGNFKVGTPFSYQEKDLKDLIEKVLTCIKEEYKEHILKKPDSLFSRQGRQAVLFNGDYYNLRIEPDGRLSQFHPLE